MVNQTTGTKASAEILQSIKPGHRFRLSKSRAIERDSWYLVTSVLSNKQSDARVVGAIPMPNSQYHQPLDEVGQIAVELFSVDQIAEIESVWEVDVNQARIEFLPLGQRFEVSNGDIYEIDEDGARIFHPRGKEGIDPVKRAYNLYNIIISHQVTGTVK